MLFKYVVKRLQKGLLLDYLNPKDGYRSNKYDEYDTPEDAYKAIAENKDRNCVVMQLVSYQSDWRLGE